MSEALLGQSLRVFPPELLPKLSLKLANTGPGRVGLSEYYNSFLQPAYRDEIALFVHDDVYLDDWCLIYRLYEAMQHYDVVGVAGNSDPDFAEPSWGRAANVDKYPTGWQPKEKLTGSAAHLLQGRKGIGVDWYGPAPRACKLLDGMFIAVNVGRALESETRFDEQFEFHFYDLDFCRTSVARELRIGTWPIAVTHGSGGAFGTQAWQHAMQRYLTKWGTATAPTKRGGQAASSGQPSWFARWFRSKP